MTLVELEGLKSSEKLENYKLSYNNLEYIATNRFILKFCVHIKTSMVSGVRELLKE